MTERAFSPVPEKDFLSAKRCKTQGMTYFHQHDVYEMVCFLSGSGKCVTSREECSLQPDTLYVIAPDTLHRMQYSEQEPHSMYHVYFSQDMLASLKDECGVHLEPYFAHLFSLKLGEELRSRLDYVLSFYNLRTQNAIDHAIQQTLIKCVLLTLAKQIGMQNGEPDDSHPLIERVLRYLDQHYDEEVPLDALCETFRCSKSYLCRLFRQATGQTLVSHLNSIRIQNACRLMQQTNLSISRISQLTGFNSTAYFDRQFRRFTGRTPSDYIAQHRF